MIIDQASYDSYKSMDHNLITNILETSVSVYDVSGPTPRQIDRVRFKNPSVACFSPSNQLLGVRDTSGRVLVYDLKNQKILVEQKQVKTEEGSEVYFLDEKTLCFADWDGKVYTFSISPPILKMVGNLEEYGMNVSTIIKAQNNQWILFGHIQWEYENCGKTEIYRLYFENKTFRAELLKQTPVNIDTLSISTDFDNKIFFTTMEDEDRIYSFNTQNHSIEIFTTFNPDDFSSSIIQLVVSPFGPYLAVVFDEDVKIYHLKTKKVFFSFRQKSLRNLQFLKDNRIWIGSDSKIYILDLPCLK